MTAYLVLVTWPDGSEGLLFPRPGNVQMAITPFEGEQEFETAKQHMKEYWKKLQDVPAQRVKIEGATIRLVEFERGATLQEFKL